MEPQYSWIPMLTLLIPVLLLNNGYVAYPFPTHNVTQSDMLDRRSPIELSLIPRGMFEVVWSCLVTTISCTWIAVHPNVQFVGHLSPLQRTLRKLYLMVLTLLVPEIMVTWAYRQYLASVEIYESISKVISKSNHWTKTHAHLLQMGGFRLRCSKEEKNKYDDKLIFHYGLGDGTWEGVLTYHAFLYFLKIGRIECPSISEEEIKDKSKGDVLFKALAVSHLLWFVVQIVVRASIHLDVTNIELTTSALVAATLFMYWSWWDKPLDVQCPVILRFSIAIDEPAGEEAATPSGGSDSGSISASIGTGDPSRDDAAAPLGSIGNESSSAQINCLANASDHRMTESCGTECSTSGVRRRWRELQDKVTCILHGPLARFQRELRTLVTVAVGYRVAYGRHMVRSMPVPLRRLISESDINIWSFSTYIVSWPVHALSCTFERGNYQPIVGADCSLPLVLRSTKETVLTVLYVSYIGTIPASTTEFAVAIFGCLFGAVHCAAWNYPFPTQIEQTLWRMAACTITIPFVVYGILSFALRMLPREIGQRILTAIQDWAKNLTPAYMRLQLQGEQNTLQPYFPAIEVPIQICVSIYTIARIAIFVLSLASLRKLPLTALQTVEWLIVIPHI